MLYAVCNLLRATSSFFVLKMELGSRQSLVASRQALVARSSSSRLMRTRSGAPLRASREGVRSLLLIASPEALVVVEGANPRRIDTAASEDERPEPGADCRVGSPDQASSGDDASLSYGSGMSELVWIRVSRETRTRQARMLTRRSQVEPVRRFQPPPGFHVKHGGPCARLRE